MKSFLTTLLGFAPEDRLLILHADDFGITTGSNRAIMDLLRENAITSASLMVPCAAMAEAAAYCRDNPAADVGLHLTLTSSENYAYGPVYRERPLRSLTTPEGFFPHHAGELEQHADPEEVRLELTAQIETALARGVDLTHMDNHGGSLLGLFHGRDFLEIVFDLCVQYGLPFHFPQRIVEQPFFSEEQKQRFAARITYAEERGILLIDDAAGLPYETPPARDDAELAGQLREELGKLQPGITQFVLHPAQVTEDLLALTPHYLRREQELRMMLDPGLREWMEGERIHLLGWRAIRDLQRALRKMV